MNYKNLNLVTAMINRYIELGNAVRVLKGLAARNPSAPSAVPPARQVPHAPQAAPIYSSPTFGQPAPAMDANLADLRPAFEFETDPELLVSITEPNNGDLARVGIDGDILVDAIVKNLVALHVQLTSLGVTDIPVIAPGICDVNYEKV